MYPITEITFLIFFNKEFIEYQASRKIVSCQYDPIKRIVSDRKKTKIGICKKSRKKKPTNNFVLTVIDNTINHCVKKNSSCVLCVVQLMLSAIVTLSIIDERNDQVLA